VKNECNLAVIAPESPRSFRRQLLAGGSAAFGLLLLLAFVGLGNGAHKYLHLALPGSVLGFALLCGVLLTGEKFVPALLARSHQHVRPVGNLLLSHMGVLFVPAGVGFVTETGLFRREWLPILAAAIGSTLIGLAVTGLLMHRFARKTDQTL
jgi:holin-like protein